MQSETGSEQVGTSQLINRQSLEEARKLANQYFGYPSLFSYQEELLQGIYHQRDGLGLIPTGGGKSLCYVLPALQMPGLVLVISPLIALIRDQVQRFSSAGIPCAAFDSLQSSHDRQFVWDRLERQELKLLIVSPERLSMPGFRNRLKSFYPRISLVAVDEAHCISHWGNHFRPEYRRLAEYINEFGDVRKLALTATATQQVRHDIIQSLNLKDPILVVADVLRENLKIKVLQCGGVENQLTDILNATLSTEGQGIIYCPTRRRVEEIYKMLKAANVKVGRYHAGMIGPGRREVQENFVKDKLRVVVATNAFGMGIDMPNIRFVFHAGLPSSLEHYVQEIGRAGRDGQPSRCYLFYGGRDYYIQKFIIEKSFPEIGMVRSAYHEIVRIKEQYPACDEDTLVSGMLQKLQCAEEDLALIIRLLIKEGLLSRSIPDQDMGEVNSALDVCQEPRIVSEFFNEYPRRKEAQLQKLGKIHEYVKSDHNREQVIREYFMV